MDSVQCSRALGLAILTQPVLRAVTVRTQGEQAGRGAMSPAAAQIPYSDTGMHGAVDLVPVKVGKHGQSTGTDTSRELGQSPCKSQGAVRGQQVTHGSGAVSGDSHAQSALQAIVGAGKQHGILLGTRPQKYPTRLRP